MVRDLDSQLRWLIVMVMTYVLGHVGLYFLVVYLFKTEHVSLIPLVLTVIPIVGISFGFKGKLLSKKCEYPRVTILLMIVYFATWLWLIRLYVNNVFP